MGIAAEIFKDTFGSGKRSCRIHHPVFPVKVVYQCLKSVFILKAAGFSSKGKLSGLICLFEIEKKFSLKYGRKCSSLLR